MRGEIGSHVVAEMGPTTRLDEPAGSEELLQACTALKVEFMVCEMGLRTLGLTCGALRSHVKLEPGGLATLFARRGQIVVL